MLVGLADPVEVAVLDHDPTSRVDAVRAPRRRAPVSSPPPTAVAPPVGAHDSAPDPEPAPVDDAPAEVRDPVGPIEPVEAHADPIDDLSDFEPSSDPDLDDAALAVAGTDGVGIVAPAVDDALLALLVADPKQT
jgi:hypothetical protein